MLNTIFFNFSLTALVYFQLLQSLNNDAFYKNFKRGVSDLVIEICNQNQFYHIFFLLIPVKYVFHAI